MKENSVFEKLKQALIEEKSLKKFLKYAYEYGRTTAREHSSLRTSFFKVSFLFLIIILGLDAYFLAISIDFLSIFFTALSLVWYVGITYLTFSLLGLVRDEKGIYLKKINVSNVLTILRLILIPNVFFVIVNYEKVNPYLAITLYAVCAMSDIFDGFIARLTKKITVFGRIMDPVGDIFFNSFISIALYLIDKLNIFILILILLRYMAPLLGGFFIYLRKAPFIIKSTIAGKITGILVGFYLGFLFLDLYFPLIKPVLFLVEIFMYGSIVALIFNFFYLVYRGVKLIK